MATMRNCAACNILYLPKQGELNRGRGIYCTLPCYFKSLRTVNDTGNCKSCKKQFSITKKADQKKIFCNRKCLCDYAKKMFNKKCLLCNHKIPYRSGANHRKFCSMKCSAIHTNTLKKIMHGN